jgi:hypothetical protein
MGMPVRWDHSAAASPARTRDNCLPPLRTACAVDRDLLHRGEHLGQPTPWHRQTGRWAGSESNRDGIGLQDALRAAIATCGGSCWWDVDHASWLVTLHSPGEQDFYSETQEEAPAYCLVWLMAPELGMRPFLIRDQESVIIEGLLFSPRSSHT